jgi:hypothetical protein
LLVLALPRSRRRAVFAKEAKKIATKIAAVCYPRPWYPTFLIMKIFSSLMIMLTKVIETETTCVIPYLTSMASL